MGEDKIDRKQEKVADRREKKGNGGGKARRQEVVAESNQGRRHRQRKTQRGLRTKLLIGGKG